MPWSATMNEETSRNVTFLSFLYAAYSAFRSPPSPFLQIAPSVAQPASSKVGSTAWTPPTSNNGCWITKIGSYPTSSLGHCTTLYNLYFQTYLNEFVAVNCSTRHRAWLESERGIGVSLHPSPAETEWRKELWGPTIFTCSDLNIWAVRSMGARAIESVISIRIYLLSIVSFATYSFHCL